jgi:hypothetical protein
MRSRIPEDNFLFGIACGLASMLLTFFAIRTVRLAIVDYYGDPYLFPSPRVELITILINILLFRLAIVNMKKDKTGRGILFITVISSMIFFILFYKFNFRLS